MKVETVKIVHKQSKTGYAIINKSDLKDEDVTFESFEAEAKLESDARKDKSAANKKKQKADKTKEQG